MDAPPIQYARTADGVNIAYWTLGAGPPLVYAPSWGTNAQTVWEVPQARELFARLAERYRVVYFDPRGVGMSDQAPEDVSLGGFVADIAAIFDVTQVTEAAIFGEGSSGHVAIRFAATRPEQVTALVLYGSPLSYPDWAPVSSTAAVVDLLREARTEAQLAAARQAFASIVDRVSFDDFRKLVAGLGTLGSIGRAFDEVLAWDATVDAASVLAPTLVLARQADAMYPIETMRPMAAAIPNARLLVMPGRGGWAFDGDLDPILDAIEDLLGPNDRSPALPGGFRTLLFTDLESSTALTQSLGDAKAQEALRGHNDAVRTALDAHGGEEVKHTGDGIFAAFVSAVSAVDAALQIQRELAGAEVRVRVGLNAGEPIAEDDDYFGAAVQLAARVCDRAEPGQVLVSNVVKELCTGKLFQFEEQGETTLKGFPEPVRLFVVGEGE